MCRGVRKEATQGLHKEQENHLAGLETATLGGDSGPDRAIGSEVIGFRIQEAFPRRISELPTAKIGASPAWVEDRQAWVLLGFYRALVPGSPM